MTNEEFDKVLKDQCTKIQQVLGSKAKEYASKQDRLHNFVVAGSFVGETKQKALFGMALKHIVSVRDMVLNYENNKILPTKELLDEKIGDTINYLILLKACFVEDISRGNKHDKRRVSANNTGSNR